LLALDRAGVGKWGYCVAGFRRHFFGSFCRFIRFAYGRTILSASAPSRRLYVSWEITMTRFSTSLKFVALSAALLLGACNHKEEVAATAPPPAPPPAAVVAPPPAPVRSSIIPGSEQDFKVNVGDTVHFAYNEYAIQDADKGTLSKQAAWLSRYPSVKLTVEGHCDERGTREYNLALGARRANAVKEYLVAQGVAAARLETISYGKERPICTQSNEDCWAQNRRGISVVSSGANS
jgi:peptidoglycan-associated lipoprotein